MKNYLKNCWNHFRRSALGLAPVLMLASLLRAQSQPTITSVVPSIGATGVSTSAPVVFTFSEEMDPTMTSATFSGMNYPYIYDTTQAWSAGNTVLTCTPSAGFPSNTMIGWDVEGQNPIGGTLSDFGYFTTSSGSGGVVTNTNAITSFLVGKSWYYDQTSSAAPTLNTNFPYGFSGLTVLSSNRTATNVTLTLPTAAVSNLVQNFLYPWDFYLAAGDTNLSTFNATFPSGDYGFTVSNASSNQQVTVNLPAFAQPNAPHVTNYTAAQAINPALPFTLGWDAFTGGGTTDYVEVVIGNVFETAGVGLSNALRGTATSVTIPANTLQANSNYDCYIGFYHAAITTNSGYVTVAYVASVSALSITTTTTNAAPRPVLTNAVWSAGSFAFDVLTTTGQTVTVVSGTNVTVAASGWPVLLTTNSPGSRFRVIDSRAATNKAMFDRARNGL